MPLPRDTRDWLWDIRDACEVILRCTKGWTLERYASDVVVRSCVERQFEIIAEALKRTVVQEPELASRLPDIRPIVSFRNILTHGYHIVKHDRVWKIVLEDVPPLKSITESILAERPPLER